MAKSKGNPDAENGPYATGGFVGRGKRHQGEHRAEGTVSKAVKAVKKVVKKEEGK